MNKKTDLRIIKTKKILHQSLLKLMQEKNFEKIKISNICEEALINRTTFYAHYEDKYELLLDLFEEQKELLLKDFDEEEKYESTKEYIIKLLTIIIDYIDDNQDIYSKILLHNRNGLLIDLLTNIIEKDALEKLKNNNDIKKSKLPIDIIVKFYSVGIINIGIYCLTNKNNYSKEELIEYINKLIPEKL